MANGQDNTQHTQHTDGAEGDSGADKLIHGKFKTQEEADKGYKEAERKLHEANERYARLEDRLNQFETRFADEGYGRGEQQQPQQPAPAPSQTLTRFYTDPDGTLAEVEQRASRRAYEQIRSEEAKRSSYAVRVTAWTAENPDVVPYNDLLTHYVGQTDARLAPETRLDLAARKVRERVIQLRGKPNSENNDPEQFVDGATGSTSSSGRTPAAAPVANESLLKNYVAERNSHVRKPLQHGGPRK